jgi:hypothetical protein
VAPGLRTMPLRETKTAFGLSHRRAPCGRD